MTIERHAGQAQIVCECGISQRRTYDKNDFAIMLEDAKAEGFIVEKIEGEWVHSCAGCAEAARKGRRGTLL